jgi:hypothetical protein
MPGTPEDEEEEERVELEGRVNIDEFNLDELFDSGILNAEQIAQSADGVGSQSTQSEVDKIGDQLGF